MAMNILKIILFQKNNGKFLMPLEDVKQAVLDIINLLVFECGEEYYGKNSCRNRHCPMCQGYAREKWIDNENQYLLDCQYFHIVTTVPGKISVERQKKAKYL